jgi:SM-20-related protein
MLGYLRLDTFQATPLVREPFEHLIVSNFVDPRLLATINADYPKISTSGSFPVDQVSFGPAFQAFLAELESDEFRQAFEKKFNIDLSGRPTVTTVRGRCDPRDGKIHTDSTSKIITALMYMNESWENRGGRLRLLRSATDLNDIIVEVPPTAGTLVAFKRSNNSWHGHEPFAGDRRVIQFNWLTTESNRQIAMLRHHTSAAFKRVLQTLRPDRASRP